MNQSSLVVVVLLAGAFGACTKVTPVERSPEPSTPPPVATPHPATGATERAIYLYPDLAKADSTFNRTFRELFEEKKLKDPEFLTQVEWPLDLAKRAAGILGVQQFRPTPPPTPTQVLPPPPPPPRPPGALDRGTYNEKRGVTRPPTIYYVQ